MAQKPNAQEVQVYVKCQDHPRPFLLSFSKRQRILPQVKAWCRREGYIYDTWVTRFDY